MRAKIPCRPSTAFRCARCRPGAAIGTPRDLPSNKVAAPQKNKATVNVPLEIPAFDGVALRDLQLSETYGAAVDAHGDVVQWGLGFSDELDPKASLTPQRTLTGKDIVRVQLCGPKIYALSRSGAIYVFASQRIHQLVPTSWLNKLPGAAATIDYVKLSPMQGSRSASASFVAIAAGEHHLLALAKNGSVWSVPVDEHANAYGQLGYTRTTINAAPASDAQKVQPIDWRLEPKVVARSPAGGAAEVPLDDLPAGSVWVPPSSIRFATEIRPIPSLDGVVFAQIAAGLEHSVVRTPEGRVLAWGRNGNGQLGLGANVHVDTVAVPSEVSWPRSVVGKNAQCTNVAAGSNNTFFVVQSTGAPEETVPEAARALASVQQRIDLLAVGAGQRGTLGNAQRNQLSNVPARVRTVSGLQEYSETARAMTPIPVRSLSVGADGQVAVVMDAPPMGDETRRDVYVWGANDQYQLGLGKRSNLATPALLTLSPEEDEAARHAPVLNRVLLVERRKVPGKAYDPHGNGAQRSYHVEQDIVAGGQGMAVYGRIVL